MSLEGLGRLFRHYIYLKHTVGKKFHPKIVELTLLPFTVASDGFPVIKSPFLLEINDVVGISDATKYN